MYLKYWSFRIVKRGIILLQKYVRQYLYHLHADLAFDDCVRGAIEQLEYSLYCRSKAAFIISTNYSAILSNASLRRFLILCGIYFRKQLLERHLLATRVQAVVRGGLVRRRHLHLRERLQRQVDSIICIQKYWRMNRCVKAYERRKQKAFELRLRWQVIIVQRSKLILGKEVKLIQRLYRLHNERKVRRKAVICIQRHYRAYRFYEWTNTVQSAVETSKAKVIQRQFRVHRFRRAIEFRWTRKHMAAWKIKVSPFNVLIHDVLILLFRHRELSENLSLLIW